VRVLIHGSHSHGSRVAVQSARVRIAHGWRDYSGTLDSGLWTLELELVCLVSPSPSPSSESESGTGSGARGESTGTADGGVAKAGSSL
jgi:hypothetical protein